MKSKPLKSKQNLPTEVGKTKECGCTCHMSSPARCVACRCPIHNPQPSNTTEDKKRPGCPHNYKGLWCPTCTTLPEDKWEGVTVVKPMTVSPCSTDHQYSTNLVYRHQEDGTHYEYCNECKWVNIKNLLKETEERIRKEYE